MGCDASDPLAHVTFLEDGQINTYDKIEGKEESEDPGASGRKKQWLRHGT